nr:unnamed protein product [Spirometra erinaceieuropaei]
MRTQHSHPGSTVCSTRALKSPRPVSLSAFGQEGMQVLVELGFSLVRAGHFWGVGANDGDEMGSPERQEQAHQSVVDALRQTGSSSHAVVPDVQGEARVSSLCPGATAREGVADIHLLQLALFREPDLDECSGVHLVAGQFSSY